MPKHNSKVRELSDNELKEVFNPECSKYLNKTIKINNLHALSKYLFWITNYYFSKVKPVWSGDTSVLEVQTLLDHLENYGRHFINLGFYKYFSDFKITAYHWSDSVSSNDHYKKGDFSGMVMRITCSEENKDDYFELSVATPYLKQEFTRNRFHKLAQYVNHYSKDNEVSDLNNLREREEDLAYLFLPSAIASLAEDRILEVMKESDEIKCWVILQTGFAF